MLVLSRNHLSRINLYRSLREDETEQEEEWLGAVEVDLSDASLTTLRWSTVSEEAEVLAELTIGARMTVKVYGMSIVLTVVERKPTKVRVGVDAPSEVIVLREECDEAASPDAP